MNLRDFSVFNRRRCEAAHGFNHKMESWSLSDWFTATMGELGEAANVAKKLNRVRDGIPGNAETPGELRAQLADEIADTFIYLDLLAQSAGVDLEAAVIAKFNKTSLKIGYLVKERLMDQVLLKPKDVEWVVNDHAELGVKIEGQFFWLYKGESLVYETGKHDNGMPMYWRFVGKREFGECCHPPHLERLPDQYREGEAWAPLPARDL